MEDVKKEARALIRSLSYEKCEKAVEYMRFLAGKETEEPKKKYRRLRKEALLYRCAAEIDSAYKLCSLFDKWHNEHHALVWRDKEMRRRAGLAPLGIVICASDHDVFHLWEGHSEKKAEEYLKVRKEIGEANLPYVLMMLYAGADLDHAAWQLPDDKDPEYKDSVQELLLTDQNDYCRFDDPHYMIETKNPWVLSEWLKKGISIVMKAVSEDDEEEHINELTAFMKQSENERNAEQNDHMEGPQKA